MSVWLSLCPEIGIGNRDSAIINKIYSLFRNIWFVKFHILIFKGIFTMPKTENILGIWKIFIMRCWCLWNILKSHWIVPVLFKYFFIISFWNVLELIVHTLNCEFTTIFYFIFHQVNNLVITICCAILFWYRYLTLRMEVVF